MEQQNLEKQSKTVFQGLPQVEPSPFFAARVVARTQESSGLRKEVLFWRWVGALSVTAMICLTVYTNFAKNKVESSAALLAFKPYVINVDLDQSEILTAATAELILPEGLEFYSKNQDVKSLRSLRLPMPSKQQGGRLPFVVVSSRSGSMPLKIHFYDQDGQLIQTKMMNVEFVEGQHG